MYHLLTININVHSAVYIDIYVRSKTDEMLPIGDAG